MNRTPNTNQLVKFLHPKRQKMIIRSIEIFNENTKLYELESFNHNEVAYFEAGSYIPVYVEIDGNVIERPYSLCSSPKESEKGIYKICIKANSGGYVSTFIINNWKVDDTVELGAPLVAEVYNAMRDRKHIVALAGGVGVTPFYSMAQAIRDGDNDHQLTLIYGANTYEELLFKEEWKKIEKETNRKFKMVPVIANEKIDGCEHGFISLDIIKKYVEPKECSFFISGPSPMVTAMKSFLEPLKLEKRQIRVSMNGDTGFNHNNRKKDTYNLIIHMAGKAYETIMYSNETILTAIEKAGLRPAVHCRSGICGYCRSYVIKGEFSLASNETGVRKADKKLGYIHPCCSYPDNDMEIVVQRSK